MNAPRITACSIALALLVGSSAGGGDAAVGPASKTAAPAVSSTPAPTPTPSTAGPRRVSTVSVSDTATGSGSPIELSPLAELVVPVGRLRFDTEAVASAPQPTWVDIEDIGVAGADVLDVGVRANGEFEIPGAGEVGWYRWSPSPGRGGSAVLAAHIAYDGADGVFRHLDELEVGEIVTVGYQDGSVRDFKIIETNQYPKDELPFERIFARDGDPVLTLITCGGAFNRTLRSYDDNVVVYAVPT